MISFTLLGASSAQDASGRPVRFATKKVLSMAAVLACTPGTAFDRQALADVVWFDVEGYSSKSSLRQALSLFRSAVTELGLDPDRILSADRKSVGFVSDAVACDVAVLSEGLKRARTIDDTSASTEALALALQSARGEFMPGFDDPWILEKRQSLRAQVSAARLELVNRLESLSGLADAFGQAEQFFSEDPTDERLAQCVMRLAGQQGLNAIVAKTYEVLARSMRERLRVDPSDETRALAKEAVRRVRPSAALPTTNIPRLLPTLFGRESELALAVERLTAKKEALVTLCGTGGVGKTRLALEVAKSTASDFGGAVWFVDASGTETEESLNGAITAVLESNPSDFAAKLSDRRGLIVVDNLEQAEAVADAVVRHWLAEVPKLQILATSRISLGLPGEHVVELRPLEPPEVGVATSDILKNPSVGLFIDRAGLAQRGVTDSELAAIAELCRALDGLPLALCLAATKSDLFTAAEMLEQLNARFALLESTSQEFPERHQRLWTCIDWSFQLMPRGRDLLIRVSAFRGGWTAASLSAVTDQPDALEDLRVLRRCSMVEERARGASVRFDMLASIREYAESHRVDDDSVRRHALWFAENAMSRADDPGWQNTEHDNVRAAFTWCLSHDPERALRMAVALADSLGSRGRARVGIQWLSSALKVADRPDTGLLTRAYLALAWLHRNLREPGPGKEALSQCLGLLGDEPSPERLELLAEMAGLQLNEGNVAGSVETAKQALGLAEALGDRSAIGRLAGTLGVSLLMLGDLDGAEAAARQSMKLSRDSANPAALSGCHYTLAHVELMRRNFEGALRHTQASIDLLAEAGLHTGSFGRLTLLAELKMLAGDFDGGLALLKESVRRLTDAGLERDLADCAPRAAYWSMSQGDPRQGAAFLCFYAPYASGFTGRSAADWRPSFDQRMDEAKGRLTSGEWLAAAGEGSSWSVYTMAQEILML